MRAGFVAKEASSLSAASMSVHLMMRKAWGICHAGVEA